MNDKWTHLSVKTFRIEGGVKLESYVSETEVLISGSEYEEKKKEITAFKDMLVNC